MIACSRCKHGYDQHIDPLTYRIGKCLHSVVKLVFNGSMLPKTVYIVCACESLVTAEGIDTEGMELVSLVRTEVM